jgi:uncharacterized protein (TIGR03382 family)
VLRSTQQRREKEMKKFVISGLFAILAAGTASADLVELTFDMTGTSIDDATYVYGSTMENNPYAGEMIVAVGVRDVVIDFTDQANVNFAWALDLTGADYGNGIFFLTSANGPFDAGTQETFNMEFDVSVYSAQVMVADFYGDWNTGTFIGSDTGGGAVTIVSGEMYYILESNIIPAPGALALLGLAGVASRRRRK